MQLIENESYKRGEKLFSISAAMKEREWPERVTQDDRLQAVMCAIWFSAKRYLPEDDVLLAILDVEDAASLVIAMLDDLEMIPKLPAE